MHITCMHTYYDEMGKLKDYFSTKLNINRCTKFNQNASILVKVMGLSSSTNKVPVDLLMPHGFSSLSTTHYHIRSRAKNKT